MPADDQYVKDEGLSDKDVSLVSWLHYIPSIAAAFGASLVECIEALTVVLAVGLVRGWRPAVIGAGLGLAFLSATIAILGPTLARIPIAKVQAAVGILLLLFGMRWLRKAILRAAGTIASRDELAIFGRERASLRDRAWVRFRIWDPVAIGASLKIVLLEGVEVVFIVIAIGAASGAIVPASLGAAVALALVMVLGVLLHRPLARIPENSLKFGVGVLLTSFGTYWLGEGVGIEWPGSDWAVVALVGWFLIVSITAVYLCRRRSRIDPTGTAP